MLDDIHMMKTIQETQWHQHIDYGIVPQSPSLFEQILGPEMKKPFTPISDIISAFEYICLR